MAAVGADNITDVEEDVRKPITAFRRADRGGLKSGRRRDLFLAEIRHRRAHDCDGNYLQELENESIVAPVTFRNSPEYPVSDNVRRSAP